MTTKAMIAALFVLVRQLVRSPTDAIIVEVTTIRDGQRFTSSVTVPAEELAELGDSLTS